VCSFIIGLTGKVVERSSISPSPTSPLPCSDTAVTERRAAVRGGRSGGGGERPSAQDRRPVNHPACSDGEKCPFTSSIYCHYNEVTQSEILKTTTTTTRTTNKQTNKHKLVIERK
jgi:hypothetical protein